MFLESQLRKLERGTAVASIDMGGNCHAGDLGNHAAQDTPQRSRARSFQTEGAFGLGEGCLNHPPPPVHAPVPASRVLLLLVAPLGSQQQHAPLFPEHPLTHLIQKPFIPQRNPILVLQQKIQRPLPLVVGRRQQPPIRDDALGGRQSDEPVAVVGLFLGGAVTQA